MKKYLRIVYGRIYRDVKQYYIGILIFALYYALTIIFFKASCPFLLLTGFSCPGCGLLRCFRYILTFRFEAAVSLNPSCFLWFAFVLWLIVTRYFVGKDFKRINATLLAIVSLATVIIYLYGMITCFPNKIPYVYSRRNLFYYLNHHLAK